MDQTGMWKLFFATGLPELYLAVQSQRADGASDAPPPERPPWKAGPSGPLRGEAR